jgi:hypothetical protein
MSVLQSSVSRVEPGLTDKICAAIRNQIGPAAEHIQVDAEGDVVTVFGAAASYYQRQLIIYAVQNASAGCQVVDAIRVIYPPRRTSAYGQAT